MAALDVRETASTRGERPKLAALLAKLQHGDVLVVTEQAIDTPTAAGALQFGDLAAVAVGMSKSSVGRLVFDGC